jgi:nitrogenase molybdenum-iron protein alpha/beta subunit
MAAKIDEIPEDVIYPEVMEAPRYSCALAGAYSTAVGIYGAVPILHSGLGCGIGQLFGQFYAGGQNAGGPQGGTSTPCSGLVEEHVIFGGEDKLGRDPLIGFSFVIWKSQEFLQAPDMID